MNKLLIILSVFLLVGCGASRSNLNLSSVGESAPDLIKSPDDFPKASISTSDVVKNGYIRVISRSAKDQSAYEAIEAAKIEAQKNVLSIVQGVKIDANELVNKGVLTQDEAKRVITGTIRTLECGTFYDRTTGTGFACMEAPLR